MQHGETALPMIIAGGGIAGYSTALGLARIGGGSFIVEQSPNIGEIGAGLQLGPNAVRALQWLGAWDAVEPYSFSPAAIRIRDGQSGHDLLTIPLGASFERRFGGPYRVIHRADLLMGLVAAAGAIRSIAVETGVQVREISLERGAVIVGTSHGRNLRGPAIIGADGIRSTVRRFVPGAPEPRFRGYTMFRALVAAPAMPSGALEDSVCLWLCPGGHVVHYPVRAGQAVNVVAVTEAPWTSAQWSEPVTRADLDPLFDRSCEALRSLTDHPLVWTKWAAADLQPFAAWSHGRITLTGDAAHATLPFLAQGAAMALEDAAVLARTLRRNGIADGFELYSQLRAARTRRITFASRAAGRRYHLSGLGRHVRNGLLRASSPDRFLNRLAWIYGYDPLSG